MRQIILQILTDLECQKTENRKYPTATMLLELKNELNKRLIKELEEMQKEGTITIGRTINDLYIKLNV